MPLAGHAFVGVATAWSVPPRREESPAGRVAGWWLSALVGLAYLPDILGHGSVLLGVANGRVVAHSVLFAVLASAVLAPLLARGFHTSFRRAAAVALGSILGHDLLDLLQGSDRMPFWPLLKQRVRLPLAIIPDHASEEALLFLAAFLVFFFVRSAFGRRPSFSLRSREAWPGATAAGLVLSAALLTHGAKVLWERDEDRVDECLARRQYAEALVHLRHLSLWSALTHSGEVDRLTARALLGLGDRAGAEGHLLAAERAEPDDYWTLVDLALFCASSEGTKAERECRVAPYQARLERDFARRRSLPRVLARVERRLSATASSPDLD